MRDLPLKTQILVVLSVLAIVTLIIFAVATGERFLQGVIVGYALCVYFRWVDDNY
jgi:hypothetical protein